MESDEVKKWRKVSIYGALRKILDSVKFYKKSRSDAVHHGVIFIFFIE